MSAQLDHTKATTTLRWYARWIPRTDRRAGDALDEADPIKKLRLEAAQGSAVGNPLVINLPPESEIGHSGNSEVPDLEWWAVKDSNLGPAD